MLAAECAWTVLRAEHARMRELLSLLERELKSGDLKRSSSAAVRIVRLIERLQDFDKATHRPKGVALIGVLRGRSAEADDLLAHLERQRERCDELLSQAKTRLERAQSGDALAATAVEDLLAEHRRLLLDHLDKEDTLLHSQTALLLTREEWAAVVSSMSKAMRARKA
jgi:hemerythrin-like domain-containing protein